MEVFPLTQVMGDFPNPTPPPMTPYQPIKQEDPQAPIKLEQTGISTVYGVYDKSLIETLNRTKFVIEQGLALPHKTLADRLYFNGRIEQFRNYINSIVTVHAGKRRKTKKKRSRRS
jgi:hypothetical protein